jgi:hypothetical protein
LPPGYPLVCTGKRTVAADQLLRANANKLLAGATLVHAPRAPVHTATHRKPPVMMERLLLSVHQNAFLLTHVTVRNLLQDGGRAHLCATEAVHIPGSARTRHRFGDEVGTAVTSSQHAETASSPRGWQGGPAPRGDHHQTGITRVTTDKIDTAGRHGAVGRREVLRNLEKQRERSPGQPHGIPAGADHEVRGGRAGL